MHANDELVFASVPQSMARKWLEMDLEVPELCKKLWTLGNIATKRPGNSGRLG